MFVHVQTCLRILRIDFRSILLSDLGLNSFESCYKWTKISSLEINIFEINHISLICLEFFILKFTKPLQSCCCPVQKNLPRRAELAWQVSRYLWRGSVDFKKKSRPFFIIIFKLKNGNFKTRDFSPLIERVLAGVLYSLVPCLKFMELACWVLHGHFGHVYLLQIFK